ncbi:MAG: transglutaminase domain-containing protein [Bacteroidales bacterium]|nr:transglutaminase domain-containing protein [Bacteroidales bacterium]
MKRIIICLMMMFAFMSMQAQNNLTKQEKEYLDFLYKSMPLNDRLDYDTNFFVKQVRASIEAKNTFSWCKNIPENIFKHFVLVYRVNNENLDTARLYMLQELKDRVINLSMYDAALEVNHWCHEKVNYKASDGRTSAPLATLRTSWGRCGEESTFTVTALRSVGIPARQCYTPRWAHTDDNHAWVEVWVDGKWYFLGACEPEARLNVGWFDVPSKRCMMVHTTVFGKYKGKEEKNFEAEKYSKINLLGNYAPTKQLTINVFDKNHKPIKDAQVSFGLYNYAEYYPLAKIKTNKDGKASLTTGYGDLVVWVKTDKLFKQIHVAKDVTTINVTLTNNELKDQTFTITPPKELPIETLSEELVKKNNSRLLKEDSIRNAYISTFPKTDNELLKNSWGNYKEVEKVLNYKNPLSKKILKLVYEKDLRDLQADVIIDHINYIPADEQSEYVINPRIALEKLTKWRSFISKYFNKPFKDGKEVASWIEKNIKINDTDNYYNVPISPKGVLSAKESDVKSKEILFVAICRTFGIQSRYEWATGRSQWRMDDKDSWHYAFQENKTKEENNCILIVNNDKQNTIKPEYYSQFTIQRLINNEFITLDYEYDPKFEKFPETLSLPEGQYRMIVGNRNSQGKVTVKETYFKLKKGETTNITVTIPEAKEDVKSYGTIVLPEKKKIISIGFSSETDLVPLKDLNTNADIKMVFLNNAEDCPLQELQKDIPALILAVIDPYKEPSRHLLVDISKSRDDFNKKDAVLILVLDKSLLNKDFSIDIFPALPNNTVILLDENKEIEKQIIKSTDLKFQGNYPILTLIEKQNIIYLSQGYKISSQEEILKLLK